VNEDIIETLRRIQCSDAACGNLKIAMGVKLAIYEIERLRSERNEMQSELRKAETESSMLRVECGVIAAERDEARREVCFLLSRNVTQGCDGDTPEFHATARGWCYLLEEDDE
jgi:hypothetical protein